MTNEEKNKAFDAIAAEALKAIEERGIIVDYPDDFVMGYVTSLQDKDGDLIVEIHGLKQEISKLEKKLSEEFRFNTNSNQKNKELSEALADLQRRFDEQSEVLKVYHTQGKKDREEIETLSKDRYAAKRLADLRKEDIARLTSENERLKKDINTLGPMRPVFPCAGCNTVISDMVNEKDGQIAAITDQLRQAERDRDFNRQKIDQHRNTIRGHFSEIENLRNKIVVLNEELATYRHGQILSTDNGAHSFTEGSDLPPYKHDGGIKLCLGGHEITGLDKVVIDGKTITVTTSVKHTD